MRIACHHHEVKEVLALAKWLKKAGYKVGINIMQIPELSKQEIRGVVKEIKKSKADILYFADSMGSLDGSQTKKIIDDLKIVYEDYWKNSNKINTSIRLNINIKVENSNNYKISNFEKVLNQLDLIYDFSIMKFDNDYIYYQVIFNGTPNNFLKTMSNNNYKFDTQNRLWILK